MDLHLMKRQQGSSVILVTRQHEDLPVSWSNLKNFIRCDTGSFYESAQTLLEDVMKSTV